ncbi:MAG: type I methionyl aminopeptidase [bacterium]|nr:type I methionyl aminopeptidase [bacterium]
MVSIKSKHEIELMKKAGLIVYQTHQYLIPYLKEGITTKQLDKLAEEFILSHQATPSFKNYDEFPGSICTSINDVVVHGIPSNRKLKNGDIISLDIGACYKGYHGDSAWSYPVGVIDERKQYLLTHTQQALMKGLQQVKPGNYINDISCAIEEYATNHNLSVVKELVGHGIGRKLHEDPNIANYNTKKKGIRLKEGMTLAIEPILNYGTDEIEMLDDESTIVTKDNQPSAHFEHTVVVTKNGYKILTGE